MKARSSFYTTVFTGMAFWATAADAQLGTPTESRPVIEHDLVGKKICWNDGGFTIFGADGQVTDNRGRHNPWLVTEPVVVKIGIKYRQYEILPDGSFYQHRFLGGIGSIRGHIEYWGKVCS
jgi:hypothetical protein